MKLAGIPDKIETRDGQRYADFHSLRLSFVNAMLKIPGIGMKVLQVLSRHSDPRLTKAVYAHANDKELEVVVTQLDVPGKEKLDPEPDWREVAVVQSLVLRVLFTGLFTGR